MRVWIALFFRGDAQPLCVPTEIQYAALSLDFRHQGECLFGLPSIYSGY